MIIIPKNFSQTTVDKMEDSITAQTTGTTSNNSNNDTLNLLLAEIHPAWALQFLK